jgi:hypothetical protein
MTMAADRHPSESWDLVQEASGLWLEMPAFAGMTAFP